MTSTTTDTSAGPYTITRDLPVTPDEAFALITEPERLRRWKTVSATVDLRAGGAYRFTVIPGHVAAGTYREVEPGRRVVFGWGWEGSDDLPPDASTVTVTIEPTETGSRVTLVHEGLNAEQAVSHAEGWVHFFERLERLAATGDAGPDEWAVGAGPDRPDRGGRGHPRGAAAGAAPAHRRGPAEADAVRGLHLPRPRRAPDGVDRLRRRDGRRDGDRPERAAWSRRCPRWPSRPSRVAPARPRRHGRAAQRPRAPRGDRPVHPRRGVPAPRLGPRPGHRPGGGRRRPARRLRPRAGRGRGDRAAAARSFADEVEPDAGVGALERLAAYAGRTPLA